MREFVLQRALKRRFHGCNTAGSGRWPLQSSGGGALVRADSEAGMADTATMQHTLGGSYFRSHERYPPADPFNEGESAKITVA